ncbi:MAG TPA: cellulase family glycosylhydrolase [Myxococcota bacterium]|jgi:aryl-phospho-beta-D-glucosidase BglC (GH1 family)|nr:cellulase family glycosylhydrolase [Myxococcota bacterium]HPC91323.1 cellulase family glycosylhydrolase [Myxococcota bacterium]HRR74881.1 cellulase family glycosylhydrolase [Myxococcota bacterium]HRV17109.1 cellulase family glycosylhydrolase [Myxococcota bacterium]
MTRFSWKLSSLAVVLVIAGVGCDDGKPQLNEGLKPIVTDLTWFKDSDGRYLNIKGINLGGNIKVPVVRSTRHDETPQTYYGHVGDQIEAMQNGEELPFSYVGRPFSLAKAEEYFKQIKSLGFNSVRLLWLWETVYPEKKFKPDREYLEYFDKLVELAAKYDIYVMINLHENLWARTFYSLYSNWPVCQQCCNYTQDNFAINPDGKVTDIVCTDSWKAECCPQGDPMNMLWSIFPSRKRKELGIDPSDPPEVQAAKYRAGFNDRVSGDGAPIWASQVCLPEKNFASPYWGVNKLLGAAVNKTGEIITSDLFKIIELVARVMAGLDEPLITPEMEEKIIAQLNRMEPYLPPAAFESTDTYDGLPFKMWGINNGLSLQTNICFAAFFNGDEVFPDRRTVEYGYADRMDEGVEIETFYTPEEAKARAEELRSAGYTYVKVNNLRESLLEGFRGAWEEIATIGKKYPNVIGYDILNEPASVYLIMSIVLAYLELGSPDLVKSLLDAVILDEDGNPRTLPGGSTVGELGQQIIEANLALLPKDNSDETRKALGLYGADLMKVLGLNIAIDKNALEPLYEYVGEGIMKVYARDDHPPANRLTFWLEPAHSIDVLFGEPGGGIGGQYQQYATTPDIPGAKEYEEKFGEIKFVWSPHWYPDIYPNIGLNTPERTFATDEYDFRDYSKILQEKADWSKFAYNNIPVVIAEFGTYWNFRYLELDELCERALKKCRLAEDKFLDPACDAAQFNCPPGYLQSRAFEYEISTQILDNYYENYEQLLLSNMVWVYTPDSDPKLGDYWDHEDFSLVEFIQEANEPERYKKIKEIIPDRYLVDVQQPKGVVAPRGYKAFVRPYAHLISGKPISTHFYSDLHYFDPDKGIPNPEHEFQIVFQSKQTFAPTVIFVPELQYPDGFFVWLSDGYALWDQEDQWLYYYPERDEPGAEHTVTIRPPLVGQNEDDWDYFIIGDFVVGKN